LPEQAFVNESMPEYTLVMNALYPVSTEQIGKPDPLALDYMGTYSPPADYSNTSIDEPLVLNIDV
jgi:hypothetical protein